jgi:hypothetical protein
VLKLVVSFIERHVAHEMVEQATFDIKQECKSKYCDWSAESANIRMASWADCRCQCFLVSLSGLQHLTKEDVTYTDICL